MHGFGVTIKMLDYHLTVCFVTQKPPCNSGIGGNDLVIYHVMNHLCYNLFMHVISVIKRV